MFLYQLLVKIGLVKYGIERTARLIIPTILHDAKRCDYLAALYTAVEAMFRKVNRTRKQTTRSAEDIIDHSWCPPWIFRRHDIPYEAQL